MKNYRIVLEYTAPERNGTDPNEWDWTSLLDLNVDEELVVYVEEMEDVA